MSTHLLNTPASARSIPPSDTTTRHEDPQPQALRRIRHCPHPRHPPQRPPEGLGSPLPTKSTPRPTHRARPVFSTQGQGEDNLSQGSAPTVRPGDSPPVIGWTPSPCFHFLQWSTVPPSLLSSSPRRHFAAPEALLPPTGRGRPGATSAATPGKGQGGAPVGNAYYGARALALLLLFGHCLP